MTAVMLELPTEAGTALFSESAGISPFLLDLMRRTDMEPTFKSERGLLYSFQGKQQQPDEHGGTLKNIQYEVLVKDETVTLRTITETCGTNHKSGKIYRSWKTDRVLSFSLKVERHGHRVLRVYEHITRTKKYRGSFTNATARYSCLLNPYVQNGVPPVFEVANIQSEFSNFRSNPSIQHVAFTFAAWAFYQILKQLDPENPAFGAKSFCDTVSYPVFQLFPKSVFNVKAIRESIPKNYSLHSEPDVKKFITKTFGPEGIRKDMVKAVLNSPDINSIFLAARLKHLFPLDWLRDFVKSPLNYLIFNHEDTYNEGSTEGLISLLSSLTLPQRKRLLIEQAPDGHRGDASFIIRDSERIFSQLNPEQRAEHQNRFDYTSWRSLHDTLSEVQREIRTKERASGDVRLFDWKESYMKKLNDTSYMLNGETYKLSAPKNRYELDKWGNEMRNCIGSYHSQVNDLRTNVFAVHNNDVLFANLEISNNGEVIQYMMKYNSRVPEEHVIAMKAHIEDINEKIAKEAKKKLRVEAAMRKRSAVQA